MSETKRIHRMECQEPWFSLLRSGIKPVEGRKNSPKYQGIQVGDEIEFYYGNESFQARVTDIKRFPTLEAYLNGVTVEKALPGITSFDEGLEIYLQWNTHEQIARWGFLGIFVRREPL